MASNYKNGSVTPTANGKFRAFFMHNGQRISKTFSARQSALDWLAANRSSVALGEFVEPNNITCGQWIIEYLRFLSLRLKVNTMTSYKVLAKKLYPLSKIRLQALNGVQIQRVIDGIASKSIRIDSYRFLNAALKRAVKLQLIRNNPMLQVESPKYAPRKKDVFSNEEIARIYDVLQHDRYKVFFTVAFATGCRVSEIQGLKIQSVHDDFIRIENAIAQGKDSTTKTATSERDITLPTHIIRMIRQEWERKGSVLNSYIFGNSHHNAITRKTIYTNWKRILLKANVPYRNIHYIRHTHATQLLSNGIPILEVQHRLGHAHASTTLNRYGHTLINNKEKVLNAVDSLFGDMVI